MRSSHSGLVIRIGAPYNDRWTHDLMRTKGGNRDYCITGEIDVLVQRQFQSCHRLSDKKFKPAPGRFSQDMAHTRKAPPKGEQT